ncbi:calcium-binding protein [Nocardioides lijunqiniae]|uniref:calcium-binding protein n=1 Tax=Nocardioides lijunqiniae TaxID=2760832 RepID=UPI0018785F40|nr:calcium-binding protein [Nocardioides lijunqiniae]
MSRVPAPLRNRRIGGAVVTTTVAALLASMLSGTAPAVAAAPADDPGASAVLQGLISLGDALGAASEQPALATDLPLTDQSVRDVLQLRTAIGRRVNDAIAGKNPTLSTLDDVFASDPTLELTETQTLPGAPAGSIEWLLDVDLKDAVPVALSYEDERLTFGAAELDGELAGRLQGRIRIRYDASAETLREFSVVGESRLTSHVWTRGDDTSAQTGQELPIPAFPAVDGFLELQGAGAGTVDTTTVLRLRDPNGRPVITTEDLRFSTPAELFATETLPGPDDVAIRVDLTSDLAPGADGAVVVGTRDPEADPATLPYATPTISRDAGLDELTALTRNQAVTGFAQYTTAILAAESSVDAELPLLDATLTDLYSPGNRLLELLTEQATATITCGAADSSPPSGALRPGQVQYCQATTSGFTPEAGSVQWSTPDDGVTITGGGDATVGTSPTANVAVKGGDGFPVLKVSFVSDGERHRARTLMNSVQELGEAVGQLGLDGTLSYDATNRSLEVAVQEDRPAADVTERRTGGSGSLAPLTGLTGLCQAKTGTVPRVCPRTGDRPDGAEYAEPESGQAEVTTTGRAFAATFGIGLVPFAPAPAPGEQAPTEPVTYVKPGTDGLLYQIEDVSAELAEDAAMVARIGFLQVDVDVADYALTTDEVAARVSIPTEDVAIDGGTVPGAVDIRQLLGADPDQGAGDPVDPETTRGLTATADLVVKDSPQKGTPVERPLDVEGTIAATWADLAPGRLPTVVTGGAYDRLRLLDLVPSRQGVMGDGSEDDTLVDTGADFYRQFGIDDQTPAGERTVTRQLYDQDPSDAENTVCTTFDVVDEHTLTCTAGTLTADGSMAPGHHYVINGDPEALRDVLIDDLAAVLTTYDSPAESLDSERTFPLVDLVPSEVSAARTKLTQMLADIQAATTDETPDVDVSTMQAFAEAAETYLPASTTTLSLPTGGTRLELTTTLSTPDVTSVAPLRVTAGSSEVRVLGGGVDDEGLPKRVTVPLKTSSSADVRLAVDLSDATSYVGNQTSVQETVSGFTAGAQGMRDSLANLLTEYGATQTRTGAASGIAIGIGVQARTAPASSSAAWIPIGDFRDSLEHKRSVNGPAQTCGGGTGTQIAACIDLPLVSTATPSTSLATVRVALGPEDSSGGTGAGLAAQPLAYRFLTDGLAGLSRTLGDSLDGNLSGQSLPLVGTDLDAAADIPDAVSGYVGAARTALTNVSVAETATASSLATALTAALNGVTVTGLTLPDTTVTVSCGGSACASSALVSSVTAVNAPLVVQGSTSDDVGFEPGLAGIAISTNLEIPATTSWELKVSVGIERGTGPYVVLDPEDGEDAVSVLTAQVEAALPDYAADTCHDWDRSGKWEQKQSAAVASVVVASKSPAATCIDAFVGKLPSVLVDRVAAAGEGTGLDAELTVNLTPGDAADSEHRVYLPALYDRKLGFATEAEGEGRLAVYFESYASKLGFFDVLGAIDLSWSDGEFATAGLEFDQLQIDARTVYQALDTGYSKARKWLAPLNPVVDVLAKPIPVISDLSELVGGGEVSLMSILVKQNAAVGMIANLLQFQQLLARLPGAGTEAELVSLGAGVPGAFHLPAAQLGAGSCTKVVAKAAAGTATPTPTPTPGTPAAPKPAKPPCDEASLSDIKKARAASAAATPVAATAPGGTPGTPAPAPAGKNVKKEMSKDVYFSLPSITVPVLEDSTQVYDLLLDAGDATMLYVDLGHAGASASLVRKFGPFAIGPVPVVASIGGTVGLDGRFAFGFDTKGLTRTIEAAEPGDVRGLPESSQSQVFSDGFYIDDLEDGEDVPEIQLTFTVQAGASISIGFAEAGIRGGVTLDLSLDAFDPDNDGKIYSTEFAGSASGPDCAFNVSSGIVFFLTFYFSVDLFLFSIEKEFDIVRSPRLKLFEFNCATVEPKLAVKVGDDLRLTMGSHVGSRGAYPLTTDEQYTVRQMAATDANGDTKVQVSAFNLVQDYVVPRNGRILADGLEGKDAVRLYPGQLLTVSGDTTTLQEIPFTLPAVVNGGEGDDTIVTADGGDDVQGGGGNDSIDVGAGADPVVNGGPGNDLIDGGKGRDIVSGGVGDDHVSGGPGGDQVNGDAGDDVIDGGVGALPTMIFPSRRAEVIGPLLDAGDLLVGGDGSDQVGGGDGSDVAVGGTYDTSATTWESTQTTEVYGVNEANVMDTVSVTVETVTVPTLDAARTSCAATGGATPEGRDEVTGGPDRDYVIGGAGADQLSGGAGADLVCGRGGDDVLDGDGSDVVESLQGVDEIRGGPGRDRMQGDGRNDDLHGDAGDDLARGGEGDDTIAGGEGRDLLVGENGADTLVGDDAGSTEAAIESARAITCGPTTSVVNGMVDLNGDLNGDGLDDGQLEGLEVADGLVRDSAGASYTGILNGLVVAQGKIDLDGNGTIQVRSGARTGDTGVADLASLTGAVGNGDCLLGGEGVDPRLDGQLGGDYVDAGVGDERNVHGGPGPDLVRGGDGADTVHGDAGDDLVVGDAQADVLFGDGGDDTVRGGSDNDLLAGGGDTAGADDGADELLGDGGDDVLAGGNATLSRTPLAGTAVAGVGVTLLATTASGTDDVAYGGYGADWVFGQNGDDRVYGGPDADVVEGGPGSDRVQGDDGADLLVGGSSTTGAVTLTRSAPDAPDGNDEVVGDEGVDDKDASDVMAGDNARLNPTTTTGPARARWTRIRPAVEVVLFDLTTTAPPAGASSAGDTMRGGGADDLILGQGGDDDIEGGDGADGIEGGADGDLIHGNVGNDELLGGSWTAGSYDGGAGDTVEGDEGDDLVLGDNGTPVTDGSPHVRLLDAPAPGAVAPASTFGSDTLGGGPGDDRVFGQGGNDTARGGEGQDVVEGDAGADILWGDGGSDTLTGGSSSNDGVISPTRVADGQRDGNDQVHGGLGEDVMAGDNARLDPTLTARADGTLLRSVQLFDVVTSAKPAAAGTGGPDVMTGDDGRDLAFGQAGNDRVAGGTGDDYLEGNVGDDTLGGDAGEDDLVGGGSVATGAVITVNGASTVDRLLTPVTGTGDRSAAGLVDGNDALTGGDARDVLLGDNGRITRDGPNTTLAGGASGPHVVRQVAMADERPGVWSGSDRLLGGQGDDDLYGQFDNTRTARPKQPFLGQQVQGDILDGGDGDDALVGDQGVDVPTPAAALGAVDRTVSDSAGFIKELVRPAGTLVRVVTQTQPTLGGDDVVLGSAGADSVHSGAGNDVTNAGVGDDVVFAGDGADALWGGVGHDRLFGGAGSDVLDIKRRTQDAKVWQLVAPVEDTDRRRRTLNGVDVLFGGAGPDAFQADQGDEGGPRRVQGDRLIDWRGTINFYKLCESGFGLGKVQNLPTASMTSALRQLALAGGSVGSAELSIPGDERVTAYPNQGSFVCETS